LRYPKRISFAHKVTKTMNLSIYLKSIMLAGLLVASSGYCAQSVNLYTYVDGQESLLPMYGTYPTYFYTGLIPEGELYILEGECCDGFGWDGYYAVQSFPTGVFTGCCASYGVVPPGVYSLSVNLETGEYSFEGANCIDIINAGIPLQITAQNSITEGCPQYTLAANLAYENFNLQWYRNGQAIPGANENTYSHPGLLTGNSNYTLQATCPGAGSLTSNAVAIDGPGCYSDDSSPLDFMLVQNVTTTGNVPGQSIQVQFDLSWGNTWKDDINWDAAWVFMKYKNAQGEWKHAKLSTTGHDNGQGTPNVIEPTSDQMGAFIRLATEGQGNFNAEGLQLRWNYGAEGLASVSGLEIRVFAIEMVYHPQGDFSMNFDASAPGGKTPVINNRLSPLLYVNGVTGARIKGDAGIDMDGNGVIDNTTYPTGYYPFYLFKYEVSEQQYADFYNCLTTAQRGTLGLAGYNITETDGQFFSSQPNIACGESNAERLLAYADWTGLRPASFLELQKAFNGPKPPNGSSGCGGPYAVSNENTDGVYGVKGLTGNVNEPFISIISTTFSRAIHGNGVLASNGLTNESTWQVESTQWTVISAPWYCSGPFGFRLCRSAE
jgi:hypothetical protein